MKIQIFCLICLAGSLFCFFGGCKKTPIEMPVPPTPTNKTRLNVIWQRPLHPDTVEVMGAVPHVIEGDFVYQRCGPPAPTPLVRRNGNSGELIWEWSDFFKYNVEAAFFGYLTQVDTRFVVADGFGYYGIDAVNGATLWRDNISSKPVCSESSTWAIPIDQWAYSAHSPCGQPFTFDKFIVRYDFLNGSVDTVCHLNGGDSLFVGFGGLSQWVDPKGDSILIITNNGLKNNPAKSNQVIYQAYNINRKEMIWSWNDPAIKNGGTWNQVYGSRLYLQTAQKLICLEVGTWKFLWERNYKVPNSASISNVIEYKNQLIVKCDDDQLDLLDPATGTLLWQTKDVGATPIGSSQLFEGVLYYTSAGDGRIYAVDIDNRKILWAEDSPNAFIPRTVNASFFMAGVAIDTVNRRLFTCDRFYAMSIKLPK
jgi:outer membrane protein assembly factor BamB